MYIAVVPVEQYDAQSLIQTFNLRALVNLRAHLGIVRSSYVGMPVVEETAETLKQLRMASVHKVGFLGGRPQDEKKFDVLLEPDDFIWEPCMALPNSVESGFWVIRPEVSSMPGHLPFNGYFSFGWDGFSNSYLIALLPASSGVVSPAPFVN